MPARNAPFYIQRFVFGLSPFESLFVMICDTRFKLILDGKSTQKNSNRNDFLELDFSKDRQKPKTFYEQSPKRQKHIIASDSCSGPLDESESDRFKNF